MSSNQYSTHKDKTASKAWLELMRLSNLPTVLSAVVVMSLGGVLRFVTLVLVVVLFVGWNLCRPHRLRATILTNFR